MLLSEYFSKLREKKNREVTLENIVDYFDRGHFSESQENLLNEQLDNWCHHCRKVQLKDDPEDYENWMLENIIGLWFKDSNCDAEYAVQFYFEEDSDAILFRLRFG